MIHITYRAADIPARVMAAWGPPETDWQATVDQDGIILLTDDDGSWGLVELHKPDLIEVHFGCADATPVRQAITAAGNMLEWIRANFGAVRIVAKAKDRPTGIFLRWCGFRRSGPMEWQGETWEVYRFSK